MSEPIDSPAAQVATEASALRNAQEKQALNRDILKGVFGDMRQALQEGELSWKSLGNVAINALNKIIDKLENDLIDSILKVNSSGGGGGINLFSGLLSIFGFAKGGIAAKGRPLPLFAKGGVSRSAAIELVSKWQTLPLAGRQADSR